MRGLILTVVLLIASAPASYRAEIEKYRRERIEELTAPNGWLAVQGLFWLHDGVNTAGSDPSSEIRLPARAARRVGAFTMTGATVTFTTDPAATVTSGGAAVKETALDPRQGEEGGIVHEGITLFAIRRGTKIGLRMLDPDSVARRTFKALKYFPLDPAYRLHATFTPYATAKQVAVPNVLGQILQMESPGYVEFTLKGNPGRTYRLEPVYETSERKDLFFMFKDLTSRTETYEAGRFLHTPLPVGGFVDLDFNRAYNPPCAFTNFATCPLPIKENQLAVRIPAGELRFHLHQ
jgi:uncharacterized protein (DUF1684 family)